MYGSFSDLLTFYTQVLSDINHKKGGYVVKTASTFMLPLRRTGQYSILKSKIKKSIFVKSTVRIVM